jgi:hypothetical protein
MQIFDSAGIRQSMTVCSLMMTLDNPVSSPRLFKADLAVRQIAALSIAILPFRSILTTSNSLESNYFIKSLCTEQFSPRASQITLKILQWGKT